MQIVNKNILLTNTFNELYNNDVYISYFGSLDFNITNELINNVINRLKKEGLPKDFFKRIYVSFSESIENAFKHQKIVKHDPLGVVSFSRSKNAYHISVGNIIDVKQRVPIFDRIVELQKKEKKELKKMIKNNIKNASLDTADSAHIGLMKILLNASTCNHSFKELESGELLFVINTNINIHE